MAGSGQCCNVRHRDDDQRGPQTARSRPHTESKLGDHEVDEVAKEVVVVVATTMDLKAGGAQLGSAATVVEAPSRQGGGGPQLGSAFPVAEAGQKAGSPLRPCTSDLINERLSQNGYGIICICICICICIGVGIGICMCKCMCMCICISICICICRFL